MYSATSEVNSYRCTVDGIKFVLVDTPGFNDTFRDEKDILQEITTWLSKTYASGKRLNGILYLHPIVNTRVEGSSLLSLQIFRKLCGPQCYKHIFLCTTFWDIVDESVGERREAELCGSEELWGLMRQQGSAVVRIRDYYKTKDILLEIAQKSSIVLDVQREVVEESRPMENTSAGQLIDQQTAEAKQALAQQKKMAQIAAANKLAAEDATQARKLREEQERSEQLQKHQASLLEEQRIRNDQLQKQLQEAAEMKARSEQERKSRLESEAREQQQVQKREREKAEGEKKAREAQCARELATRQQRWYRQDRARRLKLTWQTHIGLLERAHAWGVLRAHVYRVENQSAAFMRTCDYCHLLVGFQDFYSEFVILLIMLSM